MTVRDQCMGSPVLRPRNGPHDDDGSAGDDHSQVAGAGQSPNEDGHGGFNCHVGGQCEEPDGDGAKRSRLVDSVRLSTGQNCPQVQKGRIAAVGPFPMGYLEFTGCPIGRLLADGQVMLLRVAVVRSGPWSDLTLHPARANNPGSASSVRQR